MYKVILSLMVFMLLLGCQQKKASENTSDQNTETAADSGKRSFSFDPAAIDRYMSKSADTMTVAVIKTKMGDIEIELFTNDAPKTTANFIGLSLAGYYNNVIFHRISRGYVLQGGDPTGTGAGGTSIYGETFEDELNPNTSSYREGYVRGVVAMANRGPNTNSSQFFIMLGNAPELPKAYTIFGRVINGMKVVDKIASDQIIPKLDQRDGTPVHPVAMEKVVIEKREREKKPSSVFDAR